MPRLDGLGYRDITCSDPIVRDDQEKIMKQVSLSARFCARRAKLMKMKLGKAASSQKLFGSKYP